MKPIALYNYKNKNKKKEIWFLAEYKMLEILGFILEKF
jgi:hypothetical protein